MCNLILSQSLNLQYMCILTCTVSSTVLFNCCLTKLIEILQNSIVIVTHLYPLTYWLHCWAIEHIRGNQFPCFLCWSANIQRHSLNKNYRIRNSACNNSLHDLILIYRYRDGGTIFTNGGPGLIRKMMFCLF